MAPALPTFSGARGVYRPLVMADADALFVAHGDEAVHHFWSGPAHASVEESRAYTRKTLEMSLFHWAITTDGAEALGRLSLFEQRPGVAEVGVIVRAAAQGKGLVSEALGFVAAHAFSALGVFRLWADIDPENEASIRLFSRNSFEREALLRHNWRTHLGLRDSVIMARFQ